jgi:hypothetical protein
MTRPPDYKFSNVSNKELYMKMFLLIASILLVQRAHAQSVDISFNGSTTTVNGVETKCSGNIAVVNGQVSCIQSGQPVIIGNQGTVQLTLEQQLSSAVLDGKAFCRSVVSNGAFGQPKGARKHCLSFANGVATDNSNTFFGNPPETVPYRIIGSSVSIGDSRYVLSDDGKTLTFESATAPNVVFSLE